MTKKKVRSSKHRELFSFFPLYFIFEKEEEPGYTWEYFLLLPFLSNPKRREFNFFYDFSVWILSGNNIYFNQSPHATLYRPMMPKGPAYDVRSMLESLCANLDPNYVPPAPLSSRAHLSVFHLGPSTRE